MSSEFASARYTIGGGSSRSSNVLHLGHWFLGIPDTLCLLDFLAPVCVSEPEPLIFYAIIF